MGEHSTIHAHCNYAVLDIYTVYLIYTKLSELLPCTIMTPPGIHIALLTYKGASNIAVYGLIADEQSASFGGVWVTVPICS